MYNDFISLAMAFLQHEVNHYSKAFYFDYECWIADQILYFSVYLIGNVSAELLYILKCLWQYILYYTVNLNRYLLSLCFVATRGQVCVLNGTASCIREKNVVYRLRRLHQAVLKNGHKSLIDSIM